MRRYSFLIILVLIFHAVFNFIWIQKNNLPVGHDEALHIGNFLKFKSIIDSGAGLSDKIKNAMFVDVDYPPLFYAVSYLYSKVWKLSFRYLEYLSTIFFILSIFMVFKIGGLLKDQRLGFYAASLFGFYPICYNFSRVYNLDLFMLFGVLLSLFLFLKAQNHMFSDIKIMLLLGVSLGFGMLSKQYFLIFLIAPALALVKKNHFNKRTVFCFGVAILLMILIALIFYSGYFLSEKKGSDIFYRVRLVDDLGWHPKYQIFNHFYYIYSIIFEQLSPFNFILFLLGFIFYVKSSDNRKPFIFSWILIPLLILSFLPCKYNRYTMPILPALALVSGYLLSSFKFKKTLFGVILIFNLYQYQCLGFNTGCFFFSNFISRLGHYPAKDDSYNITGILSSLGKNCLEKGSKIGVITDRRTELFLHIFNMSGFSGMGVAWIPFLYHDNVSVFTSEISNMDFIVYFNNGDRRISWPDKESVTRGITEVNLSKIGSDNQLIISKSEIEILINASNYFVNIDKITIRGGPVYIYKAEKF
ncbi:MAG: glycosyltransferase family 39 protein [Candidatus Omnitrophica bacterium]|nr:glycosyltransferase family 39 protein [Candidatus Omnitrophota bacterium]